MAESSSRGRLFAAGAAAALALLTLSAAPARATTFCVPGFDPERCPDNGANVAQADLETAMQSDASDGEADTVVIAPGTYTDPDTFAASGFDPLSIEGAGAGEAGDPEATRLTSGSSGNIFVVNLAASPGRQIAMRDVTVVVPASLPDGQGAGLQISGDTLERVDIEIANPGSSGIPSCPGGGAYEGGRIYATGGGSVQIGIRTGSGALPGLLTVVGVILVEPVDGIWAQSSEIPVSVRRTTIERPAQGGFLASESGQLDVDNSVVVSDSAAVAIEAFANSGADTAVQANQLTLVHEGAPSGATAVNSRSSTAGNAEVVVANSILRGYAHPYGRTALGSGAADLTIRYSNLEGEGVADLGPGTLDAGTGNIDADPLFAAAPPYGTATDLELSPGSPSVDAGDPAPGGEPADFLGSARPVDGDGDGSAVRDQGAFELQPPPAAPGPQPAPTPALGGSVDRFVTVHILGKRISFSSRGVGHLRLLCAAGEVNPPCRGRLVLRTAGRPRLGRGKRAKRRGVVLARAAFEIGAGRTKTVRLRLQGHALRLLRHHRGAERLVAIARAGDAAGNRAAVRQVLRAVFHGLRGTSNVHDKAKEKP